MKQGLALLAAHVSVCITQNKSNRYQNVNNGTGLAQDSPEVILLGKKKIGKLFGYTCKEVTLARTIPSD